MGAVAACPIAQKQGGQKFSGREQLPWTWAAPKDQQLSPAYLPMASDSGFWQKKQKCFPACWQHSTEPLGQHPCCNLPSPAGRHPAGHPAASWGLLEVHFSCPPRPQSLLLGKQVLPSCDCSESQDLQRISPEFTCLHGISSHQLESTAK